jgi:hypothetical protein
MLIPGQPLQPVQRVQAVPGYEVVYTVRYSCIVGPSFPSIEGQWTSSCDGTWTGWGWEPGHNCTTTDVTYGAACSGPLEPTYP